MKEFGRKTPPRASRTVLAASSFRAILFTSLPSCSSVQKSSLPLCCIHGSKEIGVKVRASSRDFDYLPYFIGFRRSFSHFPSQKSSREFARLQPTSPSFTVPISSESRFRSIGILKKSWQSWPSSIFTGVFAGLKLANLAILFTSLASRPSVQNLLFFVFSNFRVFVIGFHRYFPEVEVPENHENTKERKHEKCSRRWPPNNEPPRIALRLKPTQGRSE